MPESNDALENLEFIRTHVLNIEKMVWFQLASSGDRVRFVEEGIKRPNAAKVYMALGAGPIDQAKLIKQTKLSQSEVSKVCTHLEDRNFISKQRDPKNNKKLLYGWTEAERVLQISKVAKGYLK